MKFRLSLLAILLMIASTAFAQLPGRYTRYNQALQTLSQLQSENPAICRLDTMGYSTRDSVPMLRFKISDNVAAEEDEPAVFFCGGVHADEVLGVEVVMWFIQDIIRRYDRGDTTAINYVNSLEIYCVPFINPEGHLSVEGGDLDWRKNNCDNDSNGVFNFHDGVDNNRNYDFGWSLDDAPDAIVPESLQYKGTAPFTQTENVAMAAFAWRYRPLVAIDYHSPTYGRSEVAYYNWYWYSPEGHGMAPDEALMSSICTQFCSRIVDDRGDSTYESRRGLVDKGDFKTYFYANFGTASFSCEISDTTIQDTSMVDGICNRHLPGQYYLLSRALGPGVTGVIRDSVTLEPIEAEVVVTEATNADINPRLSRPDTGRFRRLLAGGTYSLRFQKTGYRTRTVTNVVVHSTGAPTVVDKLLPPVNPRPPMPLLVYPPVDTTINDVMPSFVWRTSAYATKYTFELYADSALTDPVFSDTTLIDTTLAISDTLDAGEYYWRVRGGNTYGWGPFAAARSFMFEPVDLRPAMPVLVYPPIDITIYDVVPVFVWRMAQGAVRYTFELFADSALANLVFSDTTLTDTTIAITDSLTLGDYYWRVRGGNSYGWGQFASARSFMFEPESGIGNDSLLPTEVALLQNYPNPFNMETTIMAAIPVGMVGNLTIFDIGGRLVREYSVKGNGNITRITWDGHDFNGQDTRSGIYLYRLRVGDRVISRKMVLVK
jgi:hypothetical protein